MIIHDEYFFSALLSTATVGLYCVLLGLLGELYSWALYGQYRTPTIYLFIYFLQAWTNNALPWCEKGKGRSPRVWPRLDTFPLWFGAGTSSRSRWPKMPRPAVKSAGLSGGLVSSKKRDADEVPVVSRVPGGRDYN